MECAWTVTVLTITLALPVALGGSLLLSSVLINMAKDDDWMGFWVVAILGWFPLTFGAVGLASLIYGACS